MTPDELSQQVSGVLGREMSAKELRGMLRALFPRDPSEAGAPWNLSPSQVHVVKAIAHVLRVHEEGR